MSKISMEKGVCPKCNEVNEFRIVQSINATLDPELRVAFVKGEINVVTCPHCGNVSGIDQEVLYNDMDNEFAIIFGPHGVSEETKQNWPKQKQFVPYFEYAFMADSLDEAIMLMFFCEKDGAPRNSNERDTIHQACKATLEEMQSKGVRPDYASLL